MADFKHFNLAKKFKRHKNACKRKSCFWLVTLAQCIQLYDQEKDSNMLRTKLFIKVDFWENIKVILIDQISSENVYINVLQIKYYKDVQL